MRRFRWLSISLVFLSVWGCTKELPALEGMDLVRWKTDRNGCEHQRSAMKEALDRQKEKLLALDELQVVELLGKPDRHELYKRNQKFYYYFIEPAPDCAPQDTTDSKLTIRFNAMGLAKVVVVD